MKKIINKASLVILVLFTFFYTEKITNVIKNMDDIMVKLKKTEKVSCVEPIIKNETIIPGVSCKNIDIEKSYQQMKKYNIYQEALLVYKEMLPSTTLKENKDKYIISGHKSKNMISILVIANDYLDNTLEVFKKNSINVSFIVNKNWLENNYNLVNKLKGYILINGDSKTPNYVNSIINNVLNRKDKYCFTNEKNPSFLEKCATYGSYTILTDVINNNIYKNVKTNLTSGLLITINPNKEIVKELNPTIKYIKSRGYKIESLKIHLSE